MANADECEFICNGWRQMNKDVATILAMFQLSGQGRFHYTFFRRRRGGGGRKSWMACGQSQLLWCLLDMHVRGVVTTLSSSQRGAYGNERLM